MTSFRDYLRDHAKFYCRPVECHQRASTTVTDVEVEQVLARWDSDHSVLEARHDAQMADALIDVLNEELGGSSIPWNVNGWFQQEYEEDRQIANVIRGEPGASTAETLFTTEHPDILKKIMLSLDSAVEIDNEIVAPGVRSRVDFMLTTTGGKRASLEIKAPDLFDLAEGLSKLSNAEVGLEVPLDLQSTQTGMEVIIMAFLYMVSYGTEWLGLTCFSKWVFFLLHSRGVGELPYVTYPTIENQLDNTRPFRALVGMMLAISRDIDVPSNANMDGQFRPIPVNNGGS